MSSEHEQENRIGFIQRMLASGVRQAEIARMLNISRQRIHQLVQSYDLNVPRQSDFRRQSLDLAIRAIFNLATMDQACEISGLSGYCIRNEMRRLGIERRELYESEEMTKKRFNARVLVTDGCWIWSAGRKGQHGYGGFWFGGRNVYAHRVALLLEGIDVPRDKLVCHHCDNPICVRPSHLYVGTYKTNAEDRERRGRGNRQGKKKKESNG